MLLLVSYILLALFSRMSRIESNIVLSTMQMAEYMHALNGRFWRWTLGPVS